MHETVAEPMKTSAAPTAESGPAAAGLVALSSGPVSSSTSDEILRATLRSDIIRRDPPPDVADAAKTIAGGHSYTKHVVEKAEYPAITSVVEFETLIRGVMDSATASKALSGGRHAFWQDSTATVVIYNPGAADKGTAFKPGAGIGYYNGLK